jgi:hypothetical protein
MSDEPICPKCKGQLWDNRTNKKNPKAPDFKCKDKSCDGVIWPPKNGQPARGGTSVSAEKAAYSAGPHIEGIDGPAQPAVTPTPPSLDKLFGTYTACYHHAAALCRQEFQQDASSVAVAAMAATLLITAKEKGLV